MKRKQPDFKLPPMVLSTLTLDTLKSDAIHPNAEGDQQMAVAALLKNAGAI